MADQKPSAQPTPSELAREEAKVDRFIRIASAVIGGGLLGFYVAVRAYAGAGFPTAFVIFSVSGGVVAVLSFVFGKRFWEVLLFPLARRRR